METTHDVLKHFIKDLHSAARQQLDLLPKIADAHEPLSDGLWKHFQEVKQQLGRLNELIEKLELWDPESVHCKWMEGLVKEAKEILEESEWADDEARTYALVWALRRTKHYEIAWYETVKLCLDEEHHQVIDSIIGEAKNADQKLVEYIS